jgi:hypothetical protein
VGAGLAGDQQGADSGALTGSRALNWLELWIHIILCKALAPGNRLKDDSLIAGKAGSHKHGGLLQKKPRMRGCRFFIFDGYYGS